MLMALCSLNTTNESVSAYTCTQLPGVALIVLLLCADAQPPDAIVDDLMAMRSG